MFASVTFDLQIKIVSGRPQRRLFLFCGPRFISFVTRGLDPRVHPFRKKMDCT
jgi:hypothetical protein